MNYEEALTYPIVTMEQLTADAWSMVVACEEVAKTAKAGQFVHLLPGDLFTLRRPISICEIDRRAGTIRLVFEIRGNGTRALAQLQAGDTVNMLAPLGGRGFTLKNPQEKVLIVGGGIGTPPLLSLAQHYGENATVILGFRTVGAAVLLEDFKKTGAQVILCTDDGSAGLHGLVTEPLSDYAKQGQTPMIYACGPTPMLQGCAKIAYQQHIPCEVSLEERMACGVGACLVCAVKTRTNSGEERYLHVCKDGPVFPSEEVCW